MPTYEYVCADCGRHVEAVQKFSDPPLEECPHCGGKLKRVFHPVGIVLKGSGFYSTDNRSGRSRAAKSDASPEPTGTSSSTESSTKTETKADSGAKPDKAAAAPKKKDKKA
jgi:putative FmdB family regulatory protein